LVVIEDLFVSFTIDRLHKGSIQFSVVVETLIILHTPGVIARLENIAHFNTALDIQDRTHSTQYVT